jgi:hypothetical protein
VWAPWCTGLSVVSSFEAAIRLRTCTITIILKTSCAEGIQIIDCVGWSRFWWCFQWFRLLNIVVPVGAIFIGPTTLEYSSCSSSIQPVERLSYSVFVHVANCRLLLLFINFAPSSDLCCDVGPSKFLSLWLFDATLFFLNAWFDPGGKTRLIRQNETPTLSFEGRWKLYHKNWWSGLVLTPTYKAYLTQITRSHCLCME